MNPKTAENIVREEITVKAPAEKVFDAFVDPRSRKMWWGQGEWEITGSSSDPRAGGKWDLHVIAFGRESTIHGEYRIVDRPHVVEFTWIASWYETPSTSIVRVESEEHNGETTVRLTHSGLAEAERGATKGWPRLLESLRRYVEN